jgi:hypothetical protein
MVSYQKGGALPTCSTSTRHSSRNAGRAAGTAFRRLGSASAYLELECWTAQTPAHGPARGAGVAGRVAASRQGFVCYSPSQLIPYLTGRDLRIDEETPRCHIGGFLTSRDHGQILDRARITERLKHSGVSA